MYLKACPGYKNKIYLSFVQGYRDESGKAKQKTIEKIGYLEDLEKIYDDPIAHFKEIAKQRNAEEINELVIKNLNTKIIDESYPRKNLGYIIPKKIYKEFKFDLEENKRKPRYSSIYGILKSVINGFKKIGNYSILKKAILVGYFASAMFIVYSISSIFATFKIEDKDFITKNKNYL